MTPNIQATALQARKPATTSTASAESKNAALVAIEAALDKKALEPVLIDVSGSSSYTDFLLLVSGRSDRHVQTIADAVEEAFARTFARRPIGSEGKTDGRWVLIDFGEVVVHVFYHPMREFYDLEGLWCDAPRVPLEVPEDARIAAGQLY